MKLLGCCSFPETYKVNIQVWPILSMIGSVQYNLAKWLAELLQLILNIYSKYCIKDSYIFVNCIQNCFLSFQDKFMCSFVISNLFTCFPLQETIDIYADTLYHSHLFLSPLFFWNCFCWATMSVEFSLNDKMYRQIHGIPSYFLGFFFFQIELGITSQVL